MKSRTILLVLVFFVTLISTKAQKAVSATGGEAAGSGGTVSYTVGQPVYTSFADANGNTLSQGVQQPYEIMVETGIPEAESITLQVKAYPNPASDYLFIRVGDYKNVNLKFLLYDINGKLLRIVKATGGETKIAMSGLTSGSYLVKVIDDNKEIKVFKVIKR